MLILLSVAGAVLHSCGGNEPGAGTAGFHPAVLAQPLHAGRTRPVIAVIAANSGTETTDFLIPYGVLSASGVADVYAVSMKPGPLTMMPALTVETPETIDSFAARFPDGPDYVVIPAVHASTDAELIGWVRRQAELGATSIGVCDGVLVLVRTGLLERRTATGHWMSRPKLAKEFPGTRWVDDQRYVSDGNVMTTTGVSASIPASLELVALIGGRARADEVARQFGIASWGPAHRGSDFHLSARVALTAAANWLSFWKHEEVGVPIAAGIDEVALGLTTDAYSRTYRSQAVTIAATEGPVRSRFGLKIFPDRIGAAGRSVDRVVSPLGADQPPAQALDRSLAAISHDYGERTAEFVALQLEYPRS